jgi:hypothetical protein
MIFLLCYGYPEVSALVALKGLAVGGGKEGGEYDSF